MKDKQGREYAKLSELKEGDIVTVDGDFTCLKPWSHHQCLSSPSGLYIACAEGEHDLTGQADNGEDCIGIYKGIVERPR